MIPARSSTKSFSRFLALHKATMDVPVGALANCCTSPYALPQFTVYIGSICPKLLQLMTSCVNTSLIEANIVHSLPL